MTATLAAGCLDDDGGERICTAIGCIDGFWISVVASGALPDGDYEFQLMLDDTPVTCTHPAGVSAPLANGTCNSESVRSGLLTNNGGTDGRGAPNGFRIEIMDTPSVVVLRVLHDGALVGERTLEPTYQTIMPNGAGCGPICDTAPPEELRLVLE